ncbi:hypothetical protein CDAR_580771 [Caerostris darwini]|uniref:Uncharacterized protein n=1 Tax=Caerostris darwini TaxID=1538125 RepID=A0AAV4RH02_9ARAC|nr:hypothetical protein CDAR_580771 [Caerostris darwini]
MPQWSPSLYTISSKENHSSPIGNFHVSALVPYHEPDARPTAQIKRKSRPRKSDDKKKELSDTSVLNQIPAKVPVGSLLANFLLRTIGCRLRESL